MVDNKILKNIPYLEDSDITDDGHIHNSIMTALGNKPVLLMIQGNFCGWCTVAKPEFQKLAKNPKFSVLTIQIDDNKSGQKASQKIQKVFSSKGVPLFLIFDRNGRFISEHTGERTADSLMDSMKNI